MVAIKVFFFLSLFSSLAFANSISSYNDSLLNYEKRINECRKYRSKEFEDIAPTNISKEKIRIALSYFSLKTAEECPQNEQRLLIRDIKRIEKDQSIAEFIRFNATNMLHLFNESKKNLEQAKEKFRELTENEQKRLKQLEAYTRPFDPLMSQQHYLNER